MSNKKNHLTLWIFIAIVLGVLLGLGRPHWAVGFAVGGEIFLRLLKMLVVPLVMTSVMTGILGLGDVRRLGRPGAVSIGYYLTTTVLAVIVGIVLVNAFEPGAGAPPPDATLLESARVANKEMSLGAIVEHMVLMLVTDNVIKAMAEMQLLPLIVFSMLFAGTLTILGPRAEAVSRFIVQLNEAFLALILGIMTLAPLGIFCLVTARFGEAQLHGAFLQTLQQTGKYMGTVLMGLAFHAFVTLALLLWIFARRSPWRFLGAMSPALLTAFSTASSSATLPVTLEAAVDRGGVRPEAAEFVIPLGATINMDGTALYEAVAAIYIAQVLGVDLSLMQQVTVALTATLAAIGAAGIPEAGLVTMVIVLSAVGLPTEYIGILLSVDWLLDRFRTAVNVWGDSVGCAIVERVLPVPAQADSSHHS
ncbi:solute carrier family 1, member 3 [Methylomarinovum caldicuralii]|uniref:Solute carrier family 1, member 3 n=1 Tax=Methylomarinovum caldicuralii TaxID=438856 RepID=A0AAU9C3Y2_9GAMM|nr:dicarboxylate/amino acid:cation symporter [Methylomarinovum caldicuralii]BCX82423.1 solute carrier family 1, member 3 [Methylomarinovum caldicuralii]